MYLIIIFLLAIFSFLELLTNKNLKRIYVILLLILGFILCFRYGQGTDYYNYYLLYNNIGSFKNELISSGHGELGWRLLESFMKQSGVNYPIFIVIISIIMFLCLIRAIKKYSHNKITSLLLLFPTYYLTYCMSGIRQGLVICIFLGFCLEFLEKNQYVYYFITIICLTLIHSSAITLCLLPLLLDGNRQMKKKLIIVMILILPILYFSGVYNNIIYNINEGSKTIDFNIRYAAIFVRTILLVIIIFLYKNIEFKTQDKNIKLFYKIYLFGFFIYILFSFSSTFSQRISTIYKSIEILLIPNLFYEIKKYNKNFIKNRIFCSLTVILVCSFEAYKNINSFINQASYYSWVKTYNYPIVTIFNKEKIKKYRYDRKMFYVK